MNYPELLQDLADKTAVFLTEEGLASERAKEVAHKLAEYVRREWGGHAPYIPKGVGYECNLRDYEIFEKFKGDNFTDLAREYDITEMRVRQIVAAVRVAEMRKRQGGLF